MIIVVAGPSGVGKGTVVRHLLDRDPGLWLSRSWTTRPRRPSDAPDAYEFVTRDRFLARVAEGGFLEWAEYDGQLYGTPLPQPPPGRDVVLEIEVQGARQVQAKHPGALVIFLDAPPEVLADRLRGRGEDPELIRRRLDWAVEERRIAQQEGWPVVVNDDLTRTVDEVAALIRAARERLGHADRAGGADEADGAHRVDRGG